MNYLLIFQPFLTREKMDQFQYFPMKKTKLKEKEEKKNRWNNRIRWVRACKDSQLARTEHSCTVAHACVDLNLRLVHLSICMPPKSRFLKGVVIYQLKLVTIINKLANLAI